MASAAVAAVDYSPAGGAGRGARAAGWAVLRRRRVRELTMPALPDRPVRAEVRARMDSDRLHRNLTQDQYAELLHGSGSTLSRFRRGDGKLSKVMVRRLLELHPSPGWRRLLKALVLEDAIHDGTLGAATSD